MKKNLTYCALDISAGGIAGVLATASGIGEIVDIDYQLGASSGIKDGRIVNLGMLSEAISSVVNKLKSPSGRNIKSVYVSMHGPHIFSHHSLGIIPISERANKVITSTDMRKVSEQAYSLGLNMEEEVLHQIPQGYIVDNQSRVLHPEGLCGHRLEVDLLLVSVLMQDLENMVSAVEQAGFNMGAAVLSGLATSLAACTEKEREKGCCVLDIGFDSTQLLIFEEGILRGLELFNFGWSSLTEALASELKIPYDLAEDIKMSYGNASSVNIDSQQEVLIKKDQSYRPIKRKVICSVIEKRLQEAFVIIKEKLGRYLKDHDLGQGGVIACGKTALLEGFLENLESDFSLPVRLGKIEKAPLKDLTYATALGLVQYAIATAPKFHPLKLSSYANISQKIKQKSKEIYQEYF